MSQTAFVCQWVICIVCASFAYSRALEERRAGQCDVKLFVCGLLGKLCYC